MANFSKVYQIKYISISVILAIGHVFLAILYLLSVHVLCEFSHSLSQSNVPTLDNFQDFNCVKNSYKNIYIRYFRVAIPQQLCPWKKKKKKNSVLGGNLILFSWISTDDTPTNLGRNREKSWHNVGNMWPWLKSQDLNLIMFLHLYFP